MINDSSLFIYFTLCFYQYHDRMESTGEGNITFSSILLVSSFKTIINISLLTASRIHITSEVNDELQLIGGFKTEPRGLIDVKVTRNFFFQFSKQALNCFIFLGERTDGNILADVSRCAHNQFQR